ncbi:MAG: dipeptidyl-peptidase 3 family protein [Candidatus Cyclobacteriaceae bacterium M3_2C_046]
MHQKLVIMVGLMFIFSGCTTDKAGSQLSSGQDASFQWQTEQFADLRILRYQIPDWEKLSLDQQKLVYYLTQAGLEGRDIMYEQNFRHNLEIRKALEKIYTAYQGEKNTSDWQAFETYLKRIWFSNGIHHHYSSNKIKPEFSSDYLNRLLNETGTSLSEPALTAIFDEKDAKKVSLDGSRDLLLHSAVNFYQEDVSQAEVEEFYKNKINPEDETPISYGLNSRIIKSDGILKEDIYKIGGLYGPALEKVVYWLEKAVEVAENEAQAQALKLLIAYYQTGDLEKWDEYNIAWTQAIEGDIDYINGFVEVYNDPLGYRGSYENIVQIKDFEASERMRKLMDNAQWFEDQSPIMDQHKKEKVVGVTYKVVNVAGEAGDASPATPIGVNLPNANWIRSTYGSKSVSLGNITEAYEFASGDSYIDEFGLTEEEKEIAKKYAGMGDKLHTALHEVIGHASGKLNPGIGTPKETLKNYASTMEEARADLVALYYLYDSMLVNWELMPSLQVGQAVYDDYIRNGLMIQLRRIQPGEDIEEAHMRNRQLIAQWVLEKGSAENVIERITQDGKTYFRINDYQKLRDLFGKLLRETQRIKSEGDYEAAAQLVENYGVKVDQELHQEVLRRTEKLNIAPYAGFINPVLVPEMDGNEIKAVRVEYPDDFAGQMLYYSKNYSNL